MVLLLGSTSPRLYSWSLLFFETIQKEFQISNPMSNDRRTTQPVISATFSTRGLVVLLQICLKINDGKNCGFETKARHVGPLTLQQCEAAEPIHFTFEKGLLYRLTVPILFIYILENEKFLVNNYPTIFIFPSVSFPLCGGKGGGSVLRRTVGAFFQSARRPFDRLRFCCLRLGAQP